MLHNKTSISFKDFGARQGEYKVKVSTIAGKSAITPQYGRLLWRIVDYFNPSSILELGTSLGISTLYQFTALKSRQLYTIEGCDNVAAIARDNFHKLGFDQINLIHNTFENALESMLKQMTRMDFAFIDGNHTEEATIRYFKTFLEKSTEGSVLIFDDIHWSKGMENAWKFICSHEQVKVTIDLYRIGIVIFRKELSRQNFIIRY